MRDGGSCANYRGCGWSGSSWEMSTVLRKSQWQCVSLRVSAVKVRWGCVLTRGREQMGPNHKASHFVSSCRPSEDGGGGWEVPRFAFQSCHDYERSGRHVFTSQKSCCRTCSWWNHPKRMSSPFQCFLLMFLRSFSFWALVPPSVSSSWSSSVLLLDSWFLSVFFLLILLVLLGSSSLCLFQCFLVFLLGSFQWFFVLFSLGDPEPTFLEGTICFTKHLRNKTSVDWVAISF